MSVTIQISDTVAQHLKSLMIGHSADIDQKMRGLLEAEYRRRLTRYNLTNRRLQEKYGMNFTEFEEQQVTAKKNYSWDVESDAIAWETAVDGIETMQVQLTELTRSHD